MTQQQSGSGNNAVITKVTWTGGHTPTGEDSMFQFLAQPASAQTYSFGVQQTYSDGSIVNWSRTRVLGQPDRVDPGGQLDWRRRNLDADVIVALIIGILGGWLAGGFALVSTTRSGEKQRTLA